MNNAKNTFKIGLLILTLAFLTAGCVKGEKGQDGVSSKIVATINCRAPITGVDIDLDDLVIEYTAVLTASNDVYATAAIIDNYQQTSGTSFYAAGQAGAQDASVVITLDRIPPDNGGWWEISLDRNTLITSVTYTDVDFGPPEHMTFTPSACVVQNW